MAASGSPIPPSMMEKTWPMVNLWKLAMEVNCTRHFSFADLVSVASQVPKVDRQDAGSIEAGRMAETVVVRYLKEYWDWMLLGKKGGKLLKEESDTNLEVSFMDFSDIAISGQFFNAQPLDSDSGPEFPLMYTMHSKV